MIRFIGNALVENRQSVTHTAARQFGNQFQSILIRFNLFGFADILESMQDIFLADLGKIISLASGREL